MEMHTSAPQIPDRPPGRWRSVHLFPGQGDFSVGALVRAVRSDGMMRTAAEQVFEAMDRVAAERGLPALGSWLLGPTPPTARDLADAATGTSQLALFGASMTTHQSLCRSHGTPAAVVGVSFGEIAALTAAGVFTLCDGARIAHDLARVLASCSGGLTHLSCSERTARDLIDRAGTRNAVAGVDDGRSVVVAGVDDGRSVVVAGVDDGRSVVVAGVDDGRSVVVAGVDDDRSVVVAGVDDRRSVVEDGVDDGRSVVVAVVNDDRSVVVAGPVSELVRVEKVAAETQVTAVRLHLPFTSHHPALQAESEVFAEAVRAYDRSEAHFPVYSAVAGRAYAVGEDLPRRLADCLVRPAVVPTVLHLVARHEPDVLFEAGTGRSLATSARRVLSRLSTLTVLAPLAEPGSFP
ncbi:acyltransferase [Streptomyces sp. NPDC060223]|uniref:acyltransferase n=1 Tax=Streptomyces sp. NPDC060223 TaxID=3347077 RepID=UPI003660EEFB